ncbi:MAG: PilZ domain-containing protein [Sphingobium sp.]
MRKACPRRRAPKAMRRSVAVRHDGHRYIGRIRNISSTGAVIEGLWNVRADMQFRIELTDNYVVEALCRWSDEDRMGVRLLSETDLNRVIRICVPRARILIPLSMVSGGRKIRRCGAANPKLE